MYLRRNLSSETHLLFTNKNNLKWLSCRSANLMRNSLKAIFLLGDVAQNHPEFRKEVSEKYSRHLFVAGGEYITCVPVDMCLCGGALSGTHAAHPVRALPPPRWTAQLCLRRSPSEFLLTHQVFLAMWITCIWDACHSSLCHHTGAARVQEFNANPPYRDSETTIKTQFAFPKGVGERGN